MNIVSVIKCLKGSDGKCFQVEFMRNWIGGQKKLRLINLKHSRIADRISKQARLNAIVEPRQICWIDTKYDGCLSNFGSSKAEFQFRFSLKSSDIYHDHLKQI